MVMVGTQLVVVESCLAHVAARAERALEGGGRTGAADVVVLHPSHTAALELTALERGRNGGRERAREVARASTQHSLLLYLLITRM